MSAKLLQKIQVPEEVSRITKTLKNKGFEAYLIGGCVRDLLLKRVPKDWDVTTNAKPDEIVGLFANTFYENTYGTVGVVNEETADEKLKIIEVTPYRVESEYSDNRRPDSVTFSESIEDDLKRRDFTINAIALDESKGQLIDLYKGQEDLLAKIIRTVGNPLERFNEDALRMIRAVRISTELGFTINIETENAIKSSLNLIDNISKERIRDEFSRIIMSEHPMEGLLKLEKYGLLDHVSREIGSGRGVTQTQAHKYDVFEHILRSLQCAADKKWPLEIRLAALFHDIGKPATRRNDKGQWTFYGHEVVGAKITKKILSDLKYPKKTIDDVTTLVRWHMFFSDTEQITLSAVRRLIAHVGKEHIWDLMNLRVCDRVGTGRPKENPYRLRKYKAMVEEALRDPVTVGMLKVDGVALMKHLNEKPGPKIGFILHALLEEVLEDPSKNTIKYLEKRAAELLKLDEIELKKLGEKGKAVKQQEDEREVNEIRKKHFVE